MSREAEYLQIPFGYFREQFGAPRWSATGEAIEWEDGSTFVYGQEVGLFLEGFVHDGPLIHFAHIVHFLRLLKDESEAFQALWRPYASTNRPVRNAGALCARLCGPVQTFVVGMDEFSAELVSEPGRIAPAIPAVADPPDVAELCLRLSNGSLLSELAVERRATSALAGGVEMPALNVWQFLKHVKQALDLMSPEEVAHWLKHGREPSPDKGERVAESIVALKPRTLEGILDTLAGLERLAGAMPIVSQLVGALTLPPRRLAHQALPTGGYADVANRGRPEQILPSQFAIDDVEFLRRFAENELLYFHREEPHAPVTEEVVVLLDQGVRTWGRVRHALTASALAFTRLAGRRKLPLLIGGTSTRGRLIDPLTATDKELGTFWESSDLSPDPSRAMGQILEAGGTGRRDVVVLSHPRSVANPDFAAESLRAGPETRVFSVAIDESGQVQFREWKRGVAVKVGDFRIDFSPPPAPGSGTPRASAGPDPRGWRGDVEPVPFPFRLGVVHRIERPLFDFDHAGRWLLLSTHIGMLHAWKLDGTRAEVLPRGLVGGDVLDKVDAVIGVADGFVVGGRVGKSLVAMHYDFGSRTALMTVLGPSFEAEWLWIYVREAHSVVVRGPSYSRALDLSTREVFLSRDGKVRPSVRAIRAFETASHYLLTPPRLVVVDEATPEPDKGRSIKLDRLTGKVVLSKDFPDWSPFTPLADGHPSLRNCWVEHAQLRGDVLALVVTGPGHQSALRLFRRPEGVPTREFPPASTDPKSLTLSADGRLIARRLGERQLEVLDTTGAGRPVFLTHKGGSHGGARVKLGRYGLMIHVGKHVSLIRWDGDKLAVSTIPEGSTRSEHDIFTWPLDRPASRSTPLPPLLEYDTRRFVGCARAELTAVVDVFGQVALFDSDDRLIAMFLAFRSHVAAWTPEGTRFGPGQGASPLIDGPATPHAAEIIGRALKAASDIPTRSKNSKT